MQTPVQLKMPSTLQQKLPGKPSRYIARTITRPIKELEKGVSAIGGGNLDYRLDIHTGDEIEQLVDGFNAMSKRLKGFYEVLEDKVRERTKELEERIDELERFRKATIQREFRIKELRDRVKELEEELKKVRSL